MEGAVTFTTLRLRIHEIRPSTAKLLRLSLAGELIELLQASGHAVRQLGRPLLPLAQFTFSHSLRCLLGYSLQVLLPFPSI